MINNVENSAKKAWEMLHQKEIEIANELERSQTSKLAFKPVAITSADMFFDSIDKIKLPLPTIIPPSFKKGNKWFDWAYEWRKRGANLKPCGIKDGLNDELALKNLVVVNRSTKLNERYLIKCVAFLASIWYNDLEKFDKEKE